MHIGIDIRALEAPFRTGVGEYTVDLLEAVFNQPPRHDYYLYSNAFRPRPSPFLRQTNVHPVKTRLPNKLLTAATAIFQAPKLDQLVAKKIGTKLDVFFSPNLNVTALSRQVKHVLMIHDLSFIFFPRYYTLKQHLWHRLANIKKQAQKANHIITPSENTKRDCINYLKVAPEKISVIYPGVPTSLTKSEATPSSIVKQIYNLPERYILFVGSVEPRKNVLSLLNAFEEAQKKLSLPFSLIIVGALGKDNHVIRKKIADSPYQSSIHLLGFVAPQDKKALYQGAALVVYPSWYEGFGFPIVEAMQAGVPVIASNRSSMPEVTGTAAYLINPNYPEEITAGMVAILNNPDYAARSTKNGLERSKNFSWEKTAAAWLNVVEKL